MQTVQISADEYSRLIRSEATMECLDVYLKSEYADIKFIRSLVNYAMNYLPFTVPAEPKAKDEPETEEGWHE